MKVSLDFTWDMRRIGSWKENESITFFRSAWRKKLSKRRLKRSSQRNKPGIIEPCQRGQGREKKISGTVESTVLNSMKNLRAVNAETK